MRRRFSKRSILVIRERNLARAHMKNAYMTGIVAILIAVALSAQGGAPAQGGGGARGGGAQGGGAAPAGGGGRGNMPPDFQTHMPWSAWEGGVNAGWQADPAAQQVSEPFKM